APPDAPLSLHGALPIWLDALDQRNTPLEQIAKEADGALRADLKRLDAIFAAARKLVRDSKAPLPERVQAVRLLGRGLDHQVEDRSEEHTDELQSPDHLV